MSVFVSYRPLNDAFWFFNQAKGLPNLEAARRNRYFRAAVFLGWLSLEECVEHTIEELQLDRDKVPTAIRAKLKLLCEIREKEWRFTDWESAFLRAREARNGLVHPRPGEVVAALLEEEAVQDVLEVCRSLIESVSSFQLEIDPF